MEDGFTYRRSFYLHLQMIARTPVDKLNKEEVDVIWRTMFEDEETIGIPGAQTLTLFWLVLYHDRIDNAGKHHLAEKLRSCDDAVKALPEYNEIWDKMC